MNDFQLVKINEFIIIIIFLPLNEDMSHSFSALSILSFSSIILILELSKVH